MIMTYRDQVYEYVKKKYKASPEKLWRRYPNYAVFRHKDNSKWFGIIMDVRRDRLVGAGTGRSGSADIDGSVFMGNNRPDPADEEWVDILNVKVDDPIFADMLMRQEGYFRGYHFNKKNWVSILLDGTVPFEEICGMIDAGYLATASKQTKQEVRPPKEWIIPSNPRYYDIVSAFEQAEIIDWKQGKGIRKGDIVYMYVGAPVSAVLYKCEVTETDIPYRFANKNLTITALMKIRLLKRYPHDRFTFKVLNDDYGIFAVRGPRGIPKSLSEDLNR